MKEAESAIRHNKFSSVAASKLDKASLHYYSLLRVCGM